MSRALESVQELKTTAAQRIEDYDKGFPAELLPEPMRLWFRRRVCRNDGPGNFNRLKDKMADHSLRMPVDDKSRFLPGMPFETPCGPAEYEDRTFLLPKKTDIGLIPLKSKDKRRLLRPSQSFKIHSELCPKTAKG